MMQFDRKHFFTTVRERLFGDRLTQSQVAGMDLILDEAERRGTPISWLAYIFATVLHETARTMQPIAEYGKGKGRAYGKPDPQTGKTYYGRGHVQLTWKENYAKAARVLRLDLLAKPELAMVPVNSVRIMFQGMEEGWFAGDANGRHTMARHLNSTPPNYVEARRIINGTDKKAMIAGYAADFESALRYLPANKQAEVISQPPLDVEPVQPQAPEPTNTRPHIVTIAMAALAAASLGVVLWMLS